MKIAVFSDIHVKARFSARTLFDKRLLGYVNSSIIRSGYRMARIDAGVKNMLAAKPDLILFGGDAVSTADPREFSEAERKLRPLIESGIPILYTPGNHDRYVRAANCFRAWRQFRDMLNATIPQYNSGLYETDGLRFAVLDSAVPCAPWLSCGTLTDDSLAFVRRLAASEDSRPLVLLTHFPCWTGNGKTVFERRHGLRGYDRLQQIILGAPRIPLIIAGHKHTPCEKKIAENRYEIVTGSLTKHDVMRTISFEHGVFTIGTYRSTGESSRPPLVFRAN